MISGGDKADAYLKALSRKIGDGHVLRVGFLEGATYPDGTPVATVAAVQNFGAPARGIPPRPFFTNMVRDKSPGWGKAFATLWKQTDGDIGKVLALMGEGIAGQLRQSIVDTNSPPLADATIDAKGFAKPLIDTGHMFNSVNYEVDGEAAENDTPTNIRAAYTG